MKLGAYYFELTEHELRRHIERCEARITHAQSEIRALKKILKQKTEFRRELDTPRKKAS